MFEMQKMMEQMMKQMMGPEGMGKAPGMMPGMNAGDEPGFPFNMMKQCMGMFQQQSEPKESDKQ